ncbi:MAG: prepilin-type N-terminal cleavage/methylation domain-containing protein [Verrucomicrobiota bacterium]
MKNRERGFSLIEMIAAISVFTIISLMMVSMVDGVTGAVRASNKTLDMDSEARLIFGLIQRDLDQIVSSGAADLQTIKKPDNDIFYFFTESPAFNDFNQQDTGKYSVVGYRTSTKKNDPLSLQLERFGIGLAWDSNASNGANSNTGPDQMVFTSYNPTDGTVRPEVQIRPEGQLDSQSRWNAIINDGIAAEDSPFFSVIGPQLIRFEYCFLLKDGSYSNFPVIGPDPNNPPTTNGNDPDNGTSGNVGDRLFNLDTGRAFACTAVNLGTGNRTWLHHGLNDVAAIVFTIVLMDERSRLIAGDTNLLVSRFLDLDNTELQASLPLETWSDEINDPNFATIAGIPLEAAQNLKVYQRFLYLD